MKTQNFLAFQSLFPVLFCPQFRTTESVFVLWVPVLAFLGCALSPVKGLIPCASDPLPSRDFAKDAPQACRIHTEVRANKATLHFCANNQYEVLGPSFPMNQQPLSAGANT